MSGRRLWFERPDADTNEFVLQGESKGGRMTDPASISGSPDARSPMRWCLFCLTFYQTQPAPG